MAQNGERNLLATGIALTSFLRVCTGARRVQQPPKKPHSQSTWTAGPQNNVQSPSCDLQLHTGQVCPQGGTPQGARLGRRPSHVCSSYYHDPGWKTGEVRSCCHVVMCVSQFPTFTHPCSWLHTTLVCREISSQTVVAGRGLATRRSTTSWSGQTGKSPRRLRRVTCFPLEPDSLPGGGGGRRAIISQGGGDCKSTSRQSVAPSTDAVFLCSGASRVQQPRRGVEVTSAHGQWVEKPIEKTMSYYFLAVGVRCLSI